MTTLRSINRKIRSLMEVYPEVQSVRDLSDEDLIKVVGGPIPLRLEILAVVDDLESRPYHGPLRGQDLLGSGEWICSSPKVMDLAIRNRHQWEEWMLMRSVPIGDLSHKVDAPQTMEEWVSWRDGKSVEDVRVMLGQVPLSLFKELQMTSWFKEI